MRSVLLGPDPDRLRSRLGQFRLEPTDITSYQSWGVTTSLAPRISNPRDCKSRNNGALLFPQRVDRFDHRRALGGDQRRHPSNQKQQDDHGNVRPCV